MVSGADVKMQVINLRRIFSNWFVWIFLLVFWGISSTISPFFRTISTFATIILTAVPIALVALGQTYVVLTREFDLSVGAVASLATAIASETMQLSWPMAVILVLLVGIAIGFLNGFLMIKLRVSSFIATLAMMFIVSGVALIIRPSPGGFIAKEFENLMLYEYGGIPVTAFSILVIAGFFGELILQRRTLGREIYATGGKLEAAQVMGINVNKIKIVVFIISGLCASLAGLFMAARIESGNATIGMPYLFDSFTAVFMGGTLVVGGVGNYRNSLAAALIIASISRILQFLGVSIWYQFVIKGLLLLGVASAQLISVKIRGLVIG